MTWELARGLADLFELIFGVMVFLVLVVHSRRIRNLEADLVRRIHEEAMANVIQKAADKKSF